MTSHAFFSAAKEAAAAAASASQAYSEAATAAKKAAAAAASASQAYSESVVALADAIHNHPVSEESESITTDDSIEEDAQLRWPGTPLAAVDVMQLVAALSPARCSDRIRVGFALRHNEGLLRNAGRIPEAELMATFYDLFCMRAPETYQGRRATITEYAGFTRSTAITIETLALMAEDDRVADAAAAIDQVNADGNSLPDWLEANLIVTGDNSDIVSQYDILALMRDPLKGWKFAAQHKAKRIKQFLKRWCDSKRIYFGDSEYRIGDDRFHQVHCKGIVIKASDEDDDDNCAEKALADFFQQRCTSCNSLDLLKNGICGACTPEQSYHRVKEKRVRELFEENGLTYSSHNKSIDGGFRPDFVFDALTHFVVVEVDENQHKSYPADRERDRMLSISRSLGRPTVFVRYNPDAYVSGGADQEPLPNREDILLHWVKRLVFTPRRSSYTEVLYLFFDGFVPGREEIKYIVD